MGAAAMGSSYNPRAMRILVWAFRALVLFVLFAFALNNQHEASVHGFFGTEWRTPLVIVILAAFGAGCAVGILAMTPAWWRRHRVAQRQAASQTAGDGPRAGTTDDRTVPEAGLITHPPRDGV